MRYRVTLTVETEVEVEMEAPTRAEAKKAAIKRFLKMPAAHIAGGFNGEWSVVGGRVKAVDPA